MKKESFEELIKNGSQECKISEDFLKLVKKAFEGVIYDGTYITFWGSVFSNFFKTRFYLDGRYWTTTEKYFMYQKAITFNDTETAEKILKLDNPRDVKQLGREVKNFSEEKWDKVKEEIMYKAVKAKFEQDGLCNYCIKEYPNAIFVEGSPYDKIWGVGIKFDDYRIFNKINWKGKNLLGKILTRVRDEIFEEDLKIFDE